MTGGGGRGGPGGSGNPLQDALAGYHGQVRPGASLQDAISMMFGGGYAAGYPGGNIASFAGHMRDRFRGMKAIGDQFWESPGGGAIRATASRTWQGLTRLGRFGGQLGRTAGRDIVKAYRWVGSPGAEFASRAWGRTKEAAGYVGRQVGRVTSKAKEGLGWVGGKAKSTFKWASETKAGKWIGSAVSGVTSRISGAWGTSAAAGGTSASMGGAVSALAGAAGPVTAAVVALGVAATQAAYQVLAFASAQENSIRELSAKTGMSAGEVASLDVNRIMRDFEHARDTEQSSSGLLGSRDAFERAFLPIQTLLQNIANVVAGRLLDVVTMMTEPVADLAHLFSQFYDGLPDALKGRGRNPETNDYSAWETFRKMAADARVAPAPQWPGANTAEPWAWRSQ